VDLTDLSVHEEEKYTTRALVRGVAAAFQQRGAKLKGFSAKVRSSVLPGSGLSSSAAFEVLEDFRSGIEAVFGAGSCHVLSIRPEGSIQT
jgi:galactokinase